MRERGERSDRGLEEDHGRPGERSAGLAAELRHRELRVAGCRSMAAAKKPLGARGEGEGEEGKGG